MNSTKKQLEEFIKKTLTLKGLSFSKTHWFYWEILPHLGFLAILSIMTPPYLMAVKYLLWWQALLIIPFWATCVTIAFLGFVNWLHGFIFKKTLNSRFKPSVRHSPFHNDEWADFKTNTLIAKLKEFNLTDIDQIQRVKNFYSPTTSPQTISVSSLFPIAGVLWFAAVFRDNFYESYTTAYVVVCASLATIYLTSLVIRIIKRIAFSLDTKRKEAERTYIYKMLETAEQELSFRSTKHDKKE